MDLQVTFQMLDNVAEITLEGDLNTNTVGEFESSVREAIAQQAHDIVLDMNRLNYVSSAGLRILLMARRQLPSEGSISIVGVSPTIKETLEMTGFNRIVKIQERQQSKPSVHAVDSQLRVVKPISVPGELESLDAIRAYVGKAANRAGLSEEAAYWLTLAVDEIATNIIVYGYQGSGQQGEITLRTIISADKLTLFLEDTAPPFDPRQKAPPTNLDNDMESRDPGGLGIYLALAKLDGFEYESTSMRNHNIFIMNRSQ